MAAVKYLSVLMAGLLGLTCYEGTQLTATDTEQYIETLGYTYYWPYSSNMYQTWSIKTRDDLMVIEVEIDMDIEQCGGCSCDSLEIFDGVNSAGTSLREFCETSTGNTITTSGRDMYMVFRSDFSIQKRGFRLTYRQTEETDAIWTIVGITLGVFIAIVSICVITILCCCAHKSQDQISPSRFNNQGQYPQRVWITQVPQFLPPPAYQEVSYQNPQVIEMQALNRGNLPEAINRGNPPDTMDDEMPDILLGDIAQSSMPPRQHNT